MKLNGICHVKSAPYHPSSNGLAERAVQTFKAGMKKASTQDLQLRLTRFLFQYRITPHTTTGISPAELLLGRRPRSHLDLMHPVVESRVLTSQLRQKSAHDQHAKGRSFNLEEAVYVRNYANGPKWLPGVITALRGPLSYDVTLSDDRVIRRHVDQVRSRLGSHRPDAELPDDWLPDPTPPTSPAETTSATAEVRRSDRVRSAPDRYDPSTV